MSTIQVRESLLQIENAIKQLGSVKEHLTKNALAVKAEIHAGVTRHLECLWGREVTLLGQVDQALKVKEETLHEQWARLTQAKAALQISSAAILEGSMSEKQIGEALERYKIEIVPKEAPYFSFCADQGDLQNSILHYGRIEDHSLPYLKAFVDPDNVSRNDILLKSLRTTEDWLEKKKAPDSQITGEFAFLPAEHQNSLQGHKLTFSDSISVDQSSSATPCDSNSLREWLRFEKQSICSKEEHSCKITDDSCCQGAVEMPTTSNEKPADIFQPVREDLRKWLYHRNGPLHQISNTFCPPDHKIWLLQVCQQLASLDDLKHKDFFQHVSKEPSSWLHSQISGRQATSQEGGNGADFFSHISKNIDCWLLKQAETHATEKSVESLEADKSKGPISNGCRKACRKETQNRSVLGSTFNTPSFQLEDVCKANELCRNISECVSQPDCLTLNFREKSSVKNVIDPNAAFKPLCRPLKEWLSPASQRLGEKMPNRKVTDLFSHIREVCDPVWLMQPSVVNAAESQSKKFKNDKEEANMWLQKTSFPSSHESSPPESGRSSSLSDWLLVTDESKDRDQEVPDHDKESEGWSICSDSYLFCTEQLEKDMAAADDYFSKWLYVCSLTK